MPTSLAIVLGKFIGAVLSECAPVIAAILAEGLRRAITDTVEDSAAADAALVERLRKRLRDTGHLPETGRPGPDSAGDQERAGMGT